jgi:predicted phosphodiesterase
VVPREATLRIAVLSDIHGNLEALQSVLEDLDRLGVARVVSLGDNVGYGPEPEAVVRLLWERRIPSVMGNHEWALGVPRNLSWFNPTARRALQCTEKLLSGEGLAYCKSLPPWLSEGGCRFVHGFPPADMITYLFQCSDVTLARALAGLKEDVCFVGHTHELVLVSAEEGSVLSRKLDHGAEVLNQEGPWLINAGSVGQPRDGDNRAKYVIWEPEERGLEVRFVPYDIQKTVDGIAAAGIPRVYANRLW